MCQRLPCRAVAGFLCRLWATMPCKPFGGLVGFPVVLPAVSLNAHADGWRVSGMGVVKSPFGVFLYIYMGRGIT